MKHIKTFESFVNEANTSMGAKSKRFTDSVEAWDYFTDAEDAVAADEYQAALKTLNIKADDAIVCFSGANSDWNQLIDAAKKSGIKYAEVDDSANNEMAIVFTAKQ
jgi:hypothetical protein